MPPFLAAQSSRPLHCFTVDVEEHFQVNAFEGVVSRGDWASHPSRVERNVEQLLELLDRHGAQGTFFVLGWVAHRQPWLVRRIADAGHEVASHGWWHRRVPTITRAEFREDVRASRARLEDACGRRVRGFRAPSFSILPGMEWCFDVLIEEGYAYDSSLFPIRRAGYGYPGCPAAPHVIRRSAGALHEFPLATLDWGGMRLPAAGGGYLRQLPFGLVERAFRQHERRGVPGIFYVHPWEIDPGQPRLPVNAIARLRHYRGLHRTLPRIERLLAGFRFTSIARHVEARAREAA